MTPKKKGILGLGARITRFITTLFEPLTDIFKSEKVADQRAAAHGVLEDILEQYGSNIEEKRKFWQNFKKGTVKQNEVEFGSKVDKKRVNIVLGQSENTSQKSQSNSVEKAASEYFEGTENKKWTEKTNGKEGGQDKGKEKT